MDLELCLKAMLTTMASSCILTFVGIKMPLKSLLFSSRKYSWFQMRLSTIESWNHLHDTCIYCCVSLSQWLLRHNLRPLTISVHSRFLKIVGPLLKRGERSSCISLPFLSFGSFYAAPVWWYDCLGDYVSTFSDSLSKLFAVNIFYFAQNSTSFSVRPVRIFRKAHEYIPTSKQEKYDVDLIQTYIGNTTPFCEEHIPYSNNHL